MSTAILLALLPGVVVVVHLLRASLSSHAFLSLLLRCSRSLEDRLRPYQHYKIPRYDDSLRENPLYRRAAAYISSLSSLEDSDYANVFSSAASAAFPYKMKLGGDGGGDRLYLRVDDGRTVQDSFLGASLSWTNLSDAALLLRVRRGDLRRVLRPYLDHVEYVAEEIDLRRRSLRLFTYSGEGSSRRWASVPFTHPATLETAAVDPDLRTRLRSDLHSFLRNRVVYRRLGRLWRRSYLLYGAPGTGKSSLAAAIARFLCYDVYDLDPAGAVDSLDLKALLLRTTPRSVILVENIDRHFRTGPDRDFSGMLGFMERVISGGGEEQVVVFTMAGTAPERVDPEVLRAPRVDVHVYLPLCDFRCFKAMAGGYLGIEGHKLYPQVEEAFHGGGRLSQAEVGNIMLTNRGSPGRALRTVIGALQHQTRTGEGMMSAALMDRVGSASRRTEEEEKAAVRREGESGRLWKLHVLTSLRKMGGDGGRGLGHLLRKSTSRTEN